MIKQVKMIQQEIQNRLAPSEDVECHEIKTDKCRVVCCTSVVKKTVSTVLHQR